MSGRKELDRWAKVLGATNDLAALSELVRLRQRLVNLALASLDVERSLVNAPDPDLTAALSVGHDIGLELWSRVKAIEMRFVSHERGDD
ncbi:hypothetical protein OG474_19955 [Kribbella sp. NBC_01505]|uniref:hypothetical protein n=1 Tax=Kribbella sp. NBC_01505 TaxID=2903580 RepID=UPI00386F1009